MARLDNGRPIGSGSNRLDAAAQARIAAGRPSARSQGSGARSAMSRSVSTRLEAQRDAGLGKVAPKRHRPAAPLE
jgi:hypothetical protein